MSAFVGIDADEERLLLLAAWRPSFAGYSSSLGRCPPTSPTSDSRPRRPTDGTADRQESRCALGFLQLSPHAPELRMLHRWLDTWTGVGLLAVGVEREGCRLSLSHIAEGEWRAQ